MTEHPSTPIELSPSKEMELESQGGEPLRLDHFLQTRGVFESGGQAKHGIQASEVKVNGQVETRRRRKLAPSDVVEFAGVKYVV